MGTAIAASHPPCMDTRGVYDSFRWPERARVLMTSRVVAALTFDEVQDLIAGNAFPNDSSRLQPIYEQLHSDIVELIITERGPGFRHEHTLPSKRAVVDTAKKWARNFLMFGDVHDSPSHVPGESLQKNMPHLQEIRSLIMQGYKDEKGQTCLFKSLADLNSREPRFAELMAATQLTTYRAVWRQLQAAFPRMHKVMLRVKKTRDAALVQVSTCSIDKALTGICMLTALDHSLTLSSVQPLLAPAALTSIMHHACCCSPHDQYLALTCIAAV